MKKSLFAVALVFLFATFMVGTVQAATEATGGTKNILIGATGSVAPSDLVIDEIGQGAMTSVEASQLFDGLYDFLPSPRPAPPIYNFPGFPGFDGCSGTAYRFTVTLLEDGAAWAYNATGANTFPSLPFTPVGWIPSEGVPGGKTDATAPRWYPPLFTAVPFAQVAFGFISEFFYYADFPMSFCYEYGHPVGVRFDENTNSGFRSAYDAVVTRISGKTLYVDVVRSASVGSAPGRIRIPGSVFQVVTSGVEAATGESGVPLRVAISPAGSNANNGVTRETVQIATLISRDNPGTGGAAQVVAEDAPTLRDLNIGVNDQQASNIRISEQVAGQFTDGTFFVRLPNGVNFTRAPVISVTNGITAQLQNTAYPAREIKVDVGNTPSSGAIIRISDVHLNVAQTVEAGPVVVQIGPTLTTDGQQTMAGLDDTSLAIANVVTDVVVGEPDEPVVRRSVSVSGSGGSFILRIDRSPNSDVDGKLYISLEAPTVEELAPFMYFRPQDSQVPDPETGLFVVLAAEEGTFLPSAEDDYYFEGTLGSDDPPASFLIGGLTEDFVGEQLVVKSWYTSNGLSGLVQLQEVRVSFTP